MLVPKYAVQDVSQSVNSGKNSMNGGKAHCIGPAIEGRLSPLTAIDAQQ